MKKALLPIIFLFLAPQLCLAAASVLGDLSQEKVVQQGERYEGAIILKNPGTDPSEVKVYQTDYLFYADGRNIYGEVGTAPRSNGPWISLGASRLVVPPEQTLTLRYTVQVPNSPDLRGTYWSMVMVEPIAETGADSATGDGKPRFAIQTIVRYGVQIVTTIGQTGTSKIRFADRKIITGPEEKVFQIDIENTGERWLAPLLWVELYNQEGVNMGRLESGKQRIYPGCTVRHQISLPSLSKGSYRALVVADNGDESVFGAQYILELE